MGPGAPGPPVKEWRHGYFLCLSIGRRARPIFVRDARHGRWVGKTGRREIKNHPGKTARQASQGIFARRGGDCGNPVFLRHHGHGGGVCQRRYHEAKPGNRHYHGRQRGDNYHLLDPQPYRAGRRQPLDSTAKAHHLLPYHCICRHPFDHVLQKRGEKDFIVYTSKLPSDVSYVKLLCLTIFTGLFGGHCFYVGRYLRASILLLNFLLDVFLVVFNSQIIAFSQTLVGALSTLSGFIMFAWFWDIFMVAFKKFKVPVAIDLQNEEFIIKDEKE